MSPQDTDLVELALGTLYALDKLLILLHSRKNHLDLLGARIEWEEQRAESWKEYYVLDADVEDVVKHKAQWLGSAAGQESAEQNGHASRREGSQGSHDEVGDLTTSTSASSTRIKSSASTSLDAASHSKVSSRTKRSVTASLAQCELLQVETSKLRVRIKRWSDRNVSATGRAMDSLIDHCQVPDALLDEQDRLENGVEELGGKLHFLLALWEQWKRCDELLTHLRDLHRRGRELALAAQVGAEASEAVPDEGQAALLAEQADQLKDALGVLCGHTSADKFTRDSTISSRLLSFTPAYAPAKPTHTAWLAQAQLNDEVSQFLYRELAAAAKKARQAWNDVQRYGRAARALKDMRKDVEHAQSLLGELDGTKDSVAQLLAEILGVAAQCDRTTFAQAWGAADAWSSRQQGMSADLARQEGTTLQLLKSLLRQRDASIQAGLAKNLVKEVEGGCGEKLERLLEQVKEDHKELEILCGQAKVLAGAGGTISIVTQELQGACSILSDATLPHAPPAAAQQMAARAEQLDSLEKLKSYPQVLRQARLKVKGEAISPDLHDASSVSIELLQALEVDGEKLLQRLRWEESRLKQARGVSSLDASFDELHRKGEDLRPRGEAGLDGEQQMQIQAFCDEVTAITSSVATRVDIIGRPPTLPSDQLVSTAVEADQADELIRQHVIDRCSRLNSVKDALLADCEPVEPATATPLDVPQAFMRERSKTAESATSVSSEGTSVGQLAASLEKMTSVESLVSSRRGARTSSSASSVRSSILLLDGNAHTPRSEKLAALLARLNADPLVALPAGRLPRPDEALQVDEEHAILEKDARAALADSTLLSSERFSVNKALLDRTGRVRRVRALADFGTSLKQTSSAVQTCQTAIDDGNLKGATAHTDAVKVSFAAASKALGGLQAHRLARQLFDDLKQTVSSLSEQVAQMQQSEQAIQEAPVQEGSEGPRSSMDTPKPPEAEQFVPMRYAAKEEPSSLTQALEASTISQAAFAVPQKYAIHQAEPSKHPLQPKKPRTELSSPAAIPAQVVVKPGTPDLQAPDIFSPIPQQPNSIPIPRPRSSLSASSSRRASSSRTDSPSPSRPSVTALQVPSSRPVSPTPQTKSHGRALGERTPSGNQTARWPSAQPAAQPPLRRSVSRLSNTSAPSSRRNSKASVRSDSSSRGSFKQLRRPNDYKPNPRNKLDIAVSKVVNCLPVSDIMGLRDDLDAYNSSMRRLLCPCKSQASQKTYLVRQSRGRTRLANIF